MPVVAIPLSPAAISYLEVGEADELAGTVPGLTAWSGAAPGAQAAALNQASSDVDAAMPYAGRPYDPTQARQFPRVAEDPPSSYPVGPFIAAAGAGVVTGVVWDWDPGANAPVVPRDVKLAVLYQADSIVAGAREPRLSAQHDGVVYQLTGTLAESYKRVPKPGVTTGLCRRAWMLVRQFRLRGGRLL